MACPGECVIAERQVVAYDGTCCVCISLWLLLLLEDGSSFDRQSAKCCERFSCDSDLKTALARIECIRLSVCQVRGILSDYDNSVATVTTFYDSDLDEGSDPEQEYTFVEAEAEHLEGVLELYAEYEHAVSNALFAAPVLFNVGFNGFEHVLFVPSHNMIPDDPIGWREQDRFFSSGLNDLVIPALSEALATM